jgi:hypothetical protein
VSTVFRSTCFAWEILALAGIVVLISQRALPGVNVFGFFFEAASAAEQKSAADIAREKTPNRENKLAIDGLRSLSFKHLSGLM